MDSYLAIYTDMLLSLQLGNYRGFVSLSKPLYVLAIIDSIEAIESNRINIDNLVIEQQFKKLYQRFQGDFVYTRAAYIAPFFHLASSDFYHLIWMRNLNFVLCLYVFLFFLLLLLMHSESMPFWRSVPVSLTYMRFLSLC